MDVAIILNGPKLGVEILEEYIICADGGYNILPKDITPSLILGDMDSIANIPSGIEKMIIPKEKNYSDGEYAIRFASKMEGIEKISIYAAFGGRFDHQLANLGLLVIADTLGKKAKIVDENVTVTYETGKVSIKVNPGDLISLISAEGNSKIKKGSGLYYHINDLLISALDSRGISNVAVSSKVEIEVEKGGVFLFVMKTNSQLK